MIWIVRSAIQLNLNWIVSNMHSCLDQLRQSLCAKINIKINIYNFILFWSNLLFLYSILFSCLLKYFPLYSSIPLCFYSFYSIIYILLQCVIFILFYSALFYSFVFRCAFIYSNSFFSDWLQFIIFYFASITFFILFYSILLYFNLLYCIVFSVLICITFILLIVFNFILLSSI